MKLLSKMRSLSITLSAAVVLGLSHGGSHAQALPLPDTASRGVQCQWIDEALFALVQTSSRDGEDSLSVQRLRRLQSDMQPATRTLYDALATGYRGSDAYDNGADAYTAMVGRHMDRGLRACAKAWFPAAHARRVPDCADAHLAGMAALNSRKRALPQAKALEMAQGAAPVGEARARQIVQYFYGYPVSAYADAQGAGRISGGARERCLLGQWHRLP